MESSLRAACGGEAVRVLAIDPGPADSAYMKYDGACINFGKVPNEWLLSRVRDNTFGVDRVAVEMIASYGMPVGAEVFETCLFIGQLIEACSSPTNLLPYTLVYRKDVKLHLCNSPRANDASIRQALIDRYGGKVKAIGTKAQPGPLRGVVGDAWSALAVAVTFVDSQKARET